MKKTTQILVPLFAILVACSSLQKSSPTVLRPFKEKTLSNGLRVVYIPDSTLPRVGFHLLVQAGSAQDPVGSEGLSSMTVSLLETLS